jgi:acetyl esterase/lipase
MRAIKMTKTPISRAGLDSSGVMVSDIEGIPSFSDGVKNMVRVHRPTSEPEDARLPALIYFHGGGWILGDARSAPQDTLCRNIARIAKFTVISVNYRLAPENGYETFS